MTDALLYALIILAAVNVGAMWLGYRRAKLRRPRWTETRYDRCWGEMPVLTGEAERYFRKGDGR